MKRFEGAISLDYDLVIQALPFYFVLQNNLGSRIAAKYTNPTVVDIGVGTGLTTRAIVANNPDCFVRGVDNERTMTEQARSNLESDVAAGRVEVVESDALDYLRNLQTASVDVIASSYTIHNLLRDYGARLEIESFRVLRPAGMFINNDKYASDDRQEYVSELAKQILRYDVLKEMGREDLRRIWIEHEIEDQVPERIMWTGQAIQQLRSTGFVSVSLVERAEQYAIVNAFKPTA
jgi:tRNA (cmo5U34)-methyltransferase